MHEGGSGSGAIGSGNLSKRRMGQNSELGLGRLRWGGCGFIGCFELLIRDFVGFGCSAQVGEDLRHERGFLGATMTPKAALPSLSSAMRRA